MTNVSLETAKKLSEAGIIVPTEYEYDEFEDGGWIIIPCQKHPLLPAPDTDELLAALPKVIKEKYDLTISATPRGWYASYEDNEDIEGVTYHEILCEALAELRIWCGKEGYLK